MNSIDEYQLQFNATQSKGRISQFGLAARSRDSSLGRNKLQKLNLQTVIVSKTISPAQNLLPKLSRTSQLIPLPRGLRAITEHQSPQKQLGRTIRINTELDEFLFEEEKAKGKMKRDEKQRRGSFSKQSQFINPSNDKFSKQLQSMIEQLNQLKVNVSQYQDYLNNSRKLYLVIRNIVGTRKNLRKILLQNGKQELVDFSEIKKQCIIKEFTNINGEQKLVEKYDLSLTEDIIFAKEAIEGLIVQNQLQGIRRMGDQVK